MVPAPLDGPRGAGLGAPAVCLLVGCDFRGAMGGIYLQILLLCFSVSPSLSLSLSLSKRVEKYFKIRNMKIFIFGLS